MNRRTIIIWGIVIGIAIIGIVATYIFLGNNGSFDTVSQEGDSSNEQPIDLNNTDTTNSVNVAIDPDQGSGDYYYWSIMPTKLQSKLPSPRESSIIDHFYSKDLGIAFSYEVIGINSDKYIAITPPEPGTGSSVIYLHIFETPKESGQYIEILEIPSEQRFNEISDIILNISLNEAQRKQCMVRQDGIRYSIIAKDSSVKDSTAICGPYAKGNNQFFIKPREDGLATNKLVFVSAGDKELSYDGTFQGKYWYESVVVE